MTTTTATPATCRRCHRRLTSPASITAGYGPRCQARRRTAARAIPAGFTAAQIDKARELIEDDAIVPLRGRVFRVVASDGQRTYLTAPQACNCDAGRRCRACYHQAAAIMLSAA
jgi:hypothetical protein